VSPRRHDLGETIVSWRHVSDQDEQRAEQRLVRDPRWTEHLMDSGPSDIIATPVILNFDLVKQHPDVGNEKGGDCIGGQSFRQGMEGLLRSYSNCIVLKGKGEGTRKKSQGWNGSFRPDPIQDRQLYFTYIARRNRRRNAIGDPRRNPVNQRLLDKSMTRGGESETSHAK